MKMYKYMTLYKESELDYDILVSMAYEAGLEGFESLDRKGLINFLSFAEMIQWHVQDGYVFFTDIGDTYFECEETNVNTMNIMTLIEYHQNNNLEDARIDEMTVWAYDQPEEDEIEEFKTY